MFGFSSEKMRHHGVSVVWDEGPNGYGKHERGHTSGWLQQSRIQRRRAHLAEYNRPVPSNRIREESWSHIDGLALADPKYSQTLPVDLLLGADVFPYLLLGDKKEGVVGQPIALSTIFRWVLMGKMSTTPKTKVITMYTTIDSINQTLQRFLEIEEVPTAVKSDPADLECESLYRSSTTRLSDGRYVVHLPFIQNPPILGKSKDVAMKCLSQSENRFRK